MAQEISLYQVDAFTSEVFGGNPAAICPLEAWLDDALLQSIAAENNLSETAFFVRDGDDFHLRWFTPGAEVDLCGHATLATSYVISTYLEPGRDLIGFQSKSGRLEVTRNGDLYTLDFPVLKSEVVECPQLLRDALKIEVVGTLDGMDMIALVRDAAAVRDLKPDIGRIAELDTRGLIVTARGDDCDFVSRFFAPKQGVPEDPVTGSAHCLLAPLWAEKLGKTKMTARQLSARGGELIVELKGDRVLISGRAAPYMIGTITV
ncbi:PhzF family phenazine biosynthesis protein [Denitrobaculum tricleocarpae]|uniref:PhzF family phenazine biosynthesis protein n=1 Tax=Denitrobaculum tricleocarpae TaxID=2591009 RepID=A0A545TX41_9PROT|nr:PhzF family phenazine biosynthesis protein [Denitrobaculum tricleocarpae]TQV81751.1 PhzF family phenazine biosynthesis protein [Denitrobaculum tricleocarpae]